MDRSYRLKRVPIPSIYTSDKFDNLADICKSIVNKYGLKLILDPSGDIEKYKLADDQSIEQVNESDWEILYKIANTGRYRLFCRGDIVYLVKDDYLLSQQEKTLTMTLRSPDIKNGEIPILDLSLGVGLKDQRQSIQVISWNAVGEDSAELTEVELKDIKTSGATYTDIKVKTDIVETFRILGKVKDKKQARMYALAELQKRADNLVTGNVRIPGNRNIRIGNHYTINLNELGDIGSKFTGLYRIKKTTHTIDTQQGYITLAEFERSGLTK